MYVILVYDIKYDDGGAKIWRNVFKSCKKYLHHIQNSVFEGELSKSQIFNLKHEIKTYVREDVDSVIIFKSRNKRWLDKEIWAKDDDATSNFI